jgi:formiminotetrahydrofolate cyclodeaminase
MPETPPLNDLPIAEFLDRLASGEPTPGGGSAAALAGALAAALNSMVCNLTLGKQEFAAQADEIRRLLDESEASRAGLEFAVEADASAYGKVAAAYKLPRAEDQQRQARGRAIREASRQAAREPLEVGRLAARVLDVCTRLAEIGNPRVLSDVVVAAYLARATLRNATVNVEANLPALADDPFCGEARRELARLLEGRDAQVALIAERVGKRSPA